MTMKIKHAFKF